MTQQLDPLTQALIQKALANPPAWAQQKPALPAHASIIPKSMNEDIYTHPGETAEQWFLRKASGVTDPQELNRLYQISKGPGAQDTTPLDMPAGGPYTTGLKK